MQDNLQKEVDHLARVLRLSCKLYLQCFCPTHIEPQETVDTSSHDEEEKGPLVVIPYVARMSEDMFAGCSTPE